MITKTKIEKIKECAVIPSRAHEDDVGLDLTVIDIIKQDGQVTFYGTGIKIAPPIGFYYEIVPRSSISKTGYMLANSVGIIDPSYRGEIIVALRRVDFSTPNLHLPCKIAQLVLRELYISDINVVDSLDDTIRGDGGFGSTNKKGE